MVFTVVDTPRTEVGDQSRLSDFNGDFDLTTENPIPSPSKEGNDLLRHIRGMRPQPTATSPKSRLPLADRHNVPAKPEFTPLLKSATRNNFRRSIGGPREKTRSSFETPAGLKASYLGRNSPALPFNSSVIIEEHTASSAGNEDENIQNSIVAPPAVSSSVLSTPLALTSRPGDGPLDKAGNLATLREQEARLEQLDKENFSLKLKIHFLEDLLRKSGKEFNETAAKENTELKVDKVTLQHDLKKTRKTLYQAEKDLEDSRRQLQELYDKLKTGQATSEVEAEAMDQLRKKISEQESTIQQLEEKLDTIEGLQDQLTKLQDDHNDLEAEVRQKDLELDQKDEELEALRNSGSADEKLEQQLEERNHQLEQKEDEIEVLQEALDSAEASAEQKLQENQKLLEDKDDELRDLEERMKAMENQESLLRSKTAELEQLHNKLLGKDEELVALKQKLDLSASDQSVLRKKAHELDDQNSLIEDLRSKLHAAENSLADEALEKTRAIEEKDHEIRALEQKLDSTADQDKQTESLQDHITDLEADLRDKERLIEEKEEAIDELNDNLRAAKQQSDDELNECEDRIHELELQQQNHVHELQKLRDSAEYTSKDSNQALITAHTRIRELEGQQSVDRDQEKQLQKDINKLHDQVKRLEINHREKDSKHEIESDKWASERQTLNFEKSRAVEQVATLQSTIAHLKESRGTLSDRERQLQLDLEAAETKHRAAQDSLHDQIKQLSEESQRRYRSLQDLETQTRERKNELAAAEARHNSDKDEEHSLRQKIQNLEDEVEVLQCSLEEDAEQARKDIASARKESVSLQEQIKQYQQDLSAVKNERNNLKSELKTTQEKKRERSSPRPNDWEKQDLDLKRRNEELTLEADTLQIQLQSAKDQVEKIQSLENALRDDLMASNANVNGLRENVASLESSQETAQKQVKDLRQQLQSVQQEHERKIKSNILSYEQDIQNLEQELADSQTKQAGLDAENQAAQNKISRLEARITSMEANFRAQRNSSDASAAERKDLHEMLKDAKLEAEDLAIQIKERDSRITHAASKESELRDQLKRLREERAMQTSRADAVMQELQSLKEAHDKLLDEMTSLRTLQKQVRFPRNSVSVSANATPAGGDDLTQIQKRHAAELRGLGKQIEYLSARCRREQRFRSDLSYVKQYFTKRVEMHSRCTQADLQLVNAMGIPVDEVVAEQQAEDGIAAGRTETKHGSRPSLKCVGLMVLASCRMRKAAARWAKVRKGHDALLKVLSDMKPQQADLAVVDLNSALSKKARDNKINSLRSKKGNSIKKVAV